MVGNLSEQASLCRLFVVCEAEKIADLARCHGPRPPTFSGEDLADAAAFTAWFARVALLSSGYEPLAAHGDTYAKRRHLAEELLENWEAFSPRKDTRFTAYRERTGEPAPADGGPVGRS